MWLGLNACVELTEVMRQLGRAQAAFRQALLDVADGRATTEQHYALEDKDAVTEGEAARFLDTVYLFHQRQGLRLELDTIAGSKHFHRSCSKHTVGGYANV